MTAWTSDELTRIGTATELQISSRRRDGTLGSPRPIWVVRVGDDLYVRSMYGHAGGWFPGTQVRQEGHIRAGGVDKDVGFVDADPDLNDAVDAAYRESTAATANESSAAWSTLRREPPPSSSCPADDEHGTPDKLPALEERQTPWRPSTSCSGRPRRHRRRPGRPRQHRHGLHLGYQQRRVAELRRRS